MADEHSTDTNGWGEWRRHLLLETEALRKCVEKLTDEVANMKTEIALLKYKSSAWGAIGAAIVVALYLLIEYAKK